MRVKEIGELEIGKNSLLNCIKTISGGNPIKETKSQKRIISLKFRDGTLLQFKSN